MQQSTQVNPFRDFTDPLSEEARAPQTNSNLFGFRENIDFSTIDSLDSLFETGLPLPTTDWPCFDVSF
jgi:hypothetical protein